MVNRELADYKNANNQSIRKEYRRGNLEESELNANPVQQFSNWYLDAEQNEIEEPNAMALATADLKGSVKVRFVLLKGFDQRGFRFFTNYESPKARQIEENQQASIAIYWKELERQVRIEGSVARLSAEESDEYFNSRPRDAQLGAWASNQSQAVVSREHLEKRFNEYSSKFPEGTPIPRPDHWGGFILVPKRYEFWQGRVGRLHDRFEYLRNTSGNWAISRLAP